MSSLLFLPDLYDGRYLQTNSMANPIKRMETILRHLHRIAKALKDAPFFRKRGFTHLIVDLLIVVLYSAVDTISVCSSQACLFSSSYVCFWVPDCSKSVPDGLTNNFFDSPLQFYLHTLKVRVKGCIQEKMVHNTR